MATAEVTTFLTIPEFFVEVHHMRGNVSLFEVYDPENDVWAEGDSTVWDHRRRTLDNWLAGWAMQSQLIEIQKSGIIPADHPFSKAGTSLRVTRFPHLEEEMLDAPYRPDVALWTIDPVQVAGFFDTGIAPTT